MTAQWYAIRSKPNKESFLAGQFESSGVEVFFPCVRVQPVNPRARKIRPYFPNYLFVYVDMDIVKVSTLRWMPGASGIVSFDGVPASVPGFLIDALRRQLETLNLAERQLTDGIKTGDSVVIQEGPFAGYEAIFDARISGQNRVRVLLNFLQNRRVPLEIDKQKIRKRS